MASAITLSDYPRQWEWEGDKSVWQQYQIDIQEELSKEFDAGNREVNVDIL
jgi:hypothetical protein